VLQNKCYENPVLGVSETRYKSLSRNQYFMMRAYRNIVLTYWYAVKVPISLIQPVIYLILIQKQRWNE